MECQRGSKDKDVVRSCSKKQWSKISQILERGNESLNPGAQRLPIRGIHTKTHYNKMTNKDKDKKQVEWGYIPYVIRLSA